MNSPQRLHKFGQSVWFDYIRRNMFASGELKRPVTKDGILEFSRRDDADAETMFESLEASGISRPQILSRPYSGCAAVTAGKLWPTRVQIPRVFHGPVRAPRTRPVVTP